MATAYAPPRMASRAAQRPGRIVCSGKHAPKSRAPSDRSTVDGVETQPPTPSSPGARSRWARFLRPSIPPTRTASSRPPWCSWCPRFFRASSGWCESNTSSGSSAAASQADAFNAAFVLPDMISYFLVGGAASITFVTHPHALSRRGPRGRRPTLALRHPHHHVPGAGRGHRARRNLRPLVRALVVQRFRPAESRALRDRSPAFCCLRSCVSSPAASSVRCC